MEAGRRERRCGLQREREEQLKKVLSEGNVPAHTHTVFLTQ